MEKGTRNPWPRIFGGRGHTGGQRNGGFLLVSDIYPTAQSPALSRRQIAASRSSSDERAWT